jgi:predicted HAD superfamily Cof-like phosphohydrolase
MTKLQWNIFQFMGLAGQTVSGTPRSLTDEEAILRVRLIFEELEEFASAVGVVLHGVERVRLARSHGKTDFVEAADAIADLNYVVNGAACAMGLDIEPVDDEVHRSNMTKFIDGYRRADGKWVKGPSYTPADVPSVLLSINQERVCT